MPHLATACVSVFVRGGSLQESSRLSGIGHVIEHMVFKGTRSRDRRRINLEAESLGAEVNAHTDKDHTAFHLQGLAAHAPRFVAMLGDLVQHASFPADELERERQVLLAELDEDEDDPMSTAFKLLDKTSYGDHPMARSVIGTRRNIERFSQAELLAHHGAHYTGANVIVAAAGALSHAQIEAAAQAAFGDMPAGTACVVEPAKHVGGLASRRVSGTGQAHLVLGLPIAARAQDDGLHAVAAAVLGEGMSSPLMERLREERGLVYYAACSADVFEAAGQLVIEASMAPNHFDECLTEAMRLLRLQATRVQPVDLQRARHQILVRHLRAQERASQWLEDAALDLFALGRIRSLAERSERIQAVTAPAVRDAFQAMLAAGPTVAASGQLGRGVRERMRSAMQAP